MVKIDVLIGNASGKAIASLSNGFSLSTRVKGVLRVDCMNCVSRRVGIRDGGLLHVVVRRSAGGLRRMIMIKCKARGGIGLAKTMSTISTRSLTDGPIVDATRTLTNLTPNLDMLRASNHPKRKTAIGVHKANAFSGTKASPLILVSNLSNGVSSMSPGSVRDVSFLGSTTSTSVCNGHTTGKIVLVRAGGNTRNGAAVACDGSFN